MCAAWRVPRSSADARPAAATAAGLGLWHDWGSQDRSRAFQAEIKGLGIRSTPANVGEPECNGVVERLIRTLKEECLYLNDFETLEEAREVMGACIERHNRGWLPPAGRGGRPHGPTAMSFPSNRSGRPARPFPR